MNKTHSCYPLIFLLLSFVSLFGEEPDSISTDSTTPYTTFLYGAYIPKTAPDALKEEWKNGLGVGFGYTSEMSQKIWLQMTLQGNLFSFDEESVKADLYKDGHDTTNINFDMSNLLQFLVEVGGRYTLLETGIFKPYLYVGGGYLWALGANGEIKTNYGTIELEGVDTDGILLRGGLGFEVQNPKHIGFYAQVNAQFGLALGGDSYLMYPIEAGFILPIKNLR